MTIKFEPYTRVQWLIEEHDFTKEEAEKIASQPLKKHTEVAEVFYKIHGEKVCPEPDYIFRTKEEVFIDEAEYSTDSFRLDYYPHEKQYHIHALSDEDFFVSDDVSDQFDIPKILEACQDVEKEREGTDDPVENRIDDYLEFLAEQEDDDDDTEETMFISINI